MCIFYALPSVLHISHLSFLFYALPSILSPLLRIVPSAKPYLKFGPFLVLSLSYALPSVWPLPLVLPLSYALPSVWPLSLVLPLSYALPSVWPLPLVLPLSYVLPSVWPPSIYFPFSMLYLKFDPFPYVLSIFNALNLVWPLPLVLPLYIPYLQFGPFPYVLLQCCHTVLQAVFLLLHDLSQLTALLELGEGFVIELSQCCNLFHWGTSSDKFCVKLEKAKKPNKVPYAIAYLDRYSCIHYLKYFISEWSTSYIICFKCMYNLLF